MCFSLPPPAVDSKTHIAWLSTPSKYSELSPLFSPAFPGKGGQESPSWLRRRGEAVGICGECSPLFPVFSRKGARIPLIIEEGRGRVYARVGWRRSPRPSCATLRPPVGTAGRRSCWAAPSTPRASAGPTPPPGGGVIDHYVTLATAS